MTQSGGERSTLFKLLRDMKEKLQSSMVATIIATRLAHHVSLQSPAKRAKRVRHTITLPPLLLL